MKLVTSEKIPPHCERTADGGLYARVRVGKSGGADTLKAQVKFERGWTYAAVVQWQTDTRTELQARKGPAAVKGTLGGDVAEYQRLAPLRVKHFTAANAKRRLQQQRFWCAQAIADKAPVLTVPQVKKGTRAVGKTLGELARHKLIDHLDRIRFILDQAFPAAAKDEALHAGTSNKYLVALSHLFTVLDHDQPVLNPISKISPRAERRPQRKAQDMRVVKEILRLLPARRGRANVISQARAEVLAWVHIAPIQLMRMDDPVAAFHDVPTATREQIIAGRITLTVPPRFKGRRKGPAPEPQTIPLTPYGVAALRAFVATPKAWGTFSLPSLNKAFKRACGEVQEALAAQGLTLDLSAMSVYHLKHSLATVATTASGGLVDKNGKIQQHPGVIMALGHKDGKTTAHYTASAADPLLCHVNAATTLALDDLFTQPLVPKPLALAK